MTGRSRPLQASLGMWLRPTSTPGLTASSPVSQVVRQHLAVVGYSPHGCGAVSSGGGWVVREDL